jgi:hypothetical protein
MEMKMEKPDLKVVGEITPPDYKDPVQMLRNLADNIENGNYGVVETIVVATSGDAGLETFGGGRASDVPYCAYVFGAAQVRLLNIPRGGV